MSQSSSSNYAPRFIPWLVVSVLFGLAAGAVGTLLASAYLVPEPAPAVSSLPPSRVPVPRQDAALASNPSRSAVLFFDTAPTGSGPYSSLLAVNAFGSGLVLTSDGWLLAHAASFPSGRVPEKSIAAIGGKTYKIAKSVSDPFTGVLFLKIDAINLPITAFGSSDDLPSGSVAFAFDAQGSVRRVSVTAFGEPAALTMDNLLKSSEKIQKAIRLDDVSDLLPGAMIIAPSGEIAALYAGRDADGPYAVPFESFSGIVGGVLRDGVAVRPLLGVRYVDLSLLIGAGDAARTGRGALLSASYDGRLGAVLRGSPAGLAGLAAGDVVMAVNGEEVTAKKALADLISEYAPGSQITLTVSGKDGERKVEVKLGTVTP